MKLAGNIKETVISSARANIPSTTRGQPLIRPAVELAYAIRRGNPVVALLGMDAAPVSAAIDECIELLLDDPIRVIRIHGIPGVPLTLPRIVEELGAGQRGGRPADDDELIVHVLARRGDKEEQVALIIQQAELLPLSTLAFLQVASTVFGTRTPRLQLIFAGHPRFEQLLVRDELAGLRDRLDAVILVARLPVSAASAAPDQAVPVRKVGPRRIGLSFGRGAKTLAALLALLLVIGAATLAISQRSGQPMGVGSFATTRAVPAPAGTPPAPARSQDVPPLGPPPLAALPQTALPEPPRPQAAAPPSNRDFGPAPPSVRDPSPAPTVPRPERGALPSGDQLARLRSEFDRFLAQTEWGSKRLGEGERARLFNEYLRWNYGAAGANPGPPP